MFLYEYMTEQERRDELAVMEYNKMAMKFDHAFSCLEMEHEIRLSSIDTECLIKEYTEDDLENAYIHEMEIYTEGVKELWEKFKAWIKSVVNAIFGVKDEPPEDPKTNVNLPFNPPKLSDILGKFSNAIKNVTNFKKEDGSLDKPKLGAAIGLSALVSGGSIAAALKAVKQPTKTEKGKLPGIISDLAGKVKAIGSAIASLPAEAGQLIQDMTSKLVGFANECIAKARSLLGIKGKDEEPKKEDPKKEPPKSDGDGGDGGAGDGGSGGGGSDDTGDDGKPKQDNDPPKSDNDPPPSDDSGDGGQPKQDNNPPKSDDTGDGGQPKQDNNPPKSDDDSGDGGEKQKTKVKNVQEALRDIGKKHPELKDAANKLMGTISTLKKGKKQKPTSEDINGLIDGNKIKPNMKDQCREVAKILGDEYAFEYVAFMIEAALNNMRIPSYIIESAMDELDEDMGSILLESMEDPFDFLTGNDSIVEGVNEIEDLLDLL